MAWREGQGRRTSSARRRTSRHREAEPAAVLCTLTVDDHTSADRRRSATCSAASRSSTRDGKPLVDAHGRRSYVTSAGAGPSIGKHILMAYLPPEHAVVGNELLVEYIGEHYPVTRRHRRLDAGVRPGERADPA